MFKAKPIDNQVIFITGASSGIGLATSKLATSRGAKVFLVSRNEKELEKICKEITKNGNDCSFAAADVSNIDELTAARDKCISEFGRIDTWINNAGVSIYGKLTDLNIEDEKRLFDVNFWGIRNGCHLACESLKSGGVLINLGSEVSEQALPIQGIYSASKHAVKAYTDSLRIELKHDKLPIEVCLIRPTAINTPFPIHAANRLAKGIPKIPTPMYDPYVVAEAIINCAEYPKRDVFVGGPSKLHSVMQHLMPHLADKMQLKGGFTGQIANRRKVPQQESLFKAPRREGKEHGSFDINQEKKFSAYTTVMSNPWKSILGTMTAGAVVLAVKKKFFK